MAPFPGSYVLSCNSRGANKCEHVQCVQVYYNALLFCVFLRSVNECEQSALFLRKALHFLAVSREINLFDYIPCHLHVVECRLSLYRPLAKETKFCVSDISFLKNS